MSLIKQLAKETAIYGGSYIAIRLLNYLILGLYLPRKFAGDDAFLYTQHGDLSLYIALLVVVFGLRFETAFFRFATTDDSKKVFSTAVISLLILGLLWVSIIIPNYQKVAAFLAYSDQSLYILVTACVLFFDLLYAVPLAKYRLENRPLRFAFVRLSMVIINIGLILFYFEVLPYLEDVHPLLRWLSAIPPLVFVFSSNLVGSFFGVLLIAPEYIKMRWSWNSKIFKQMITYSWPLILVAAAGVINQSGFVSFQRWLLSADILQSEMQAAPYVAASKIAILMSLFTTAFNYAVEPFFFKQNSSDNHQKDTYANVALAYTLFGCLMMCVVCSRGALGIIFHIFTPEYRTASRYVPLLFFAFFLLGLYYNFSIWYKLTDKTIYGAFIAFVGMIITIIVNTVGLPNHGIIASPLASLFCYSIMLMLCVGFGRKFFNVPYYWKRMLVPIALTLFVITITFFVPSNQFVDLLVSFVAIAVYLGYVVLYERRFLQSIFES